MLMRYANISSSFLLLLTSKSVSIALILCEIAGKDQMDAVTIFCILFFIWHVKDGSNFRETGWVENAIWRHVLLQIGRFEKHIFVVFQKIIQVYVSKINSGSSRHIVFL